MKRFLMVLFIGLFLLAVADKAIAKTEAYNPEAQPVTIYGQDDDDSTAILKPTITDLGTKECFSMELVDGSGAQITSFGSSAIAESTVPTEVADGSSGNPWYDTFMRSVIAGFNNALQALNVNNINRGPIDSGYVQILDTTLAANPTLTSASIFIGDKTDISLGFSTDITEVGNTVTVAYTVEVSPDNATWLDYDILLDSTGVDSPISSVTTTTNDQEKFVYLPEGFTGQYLKCTATGTNTDADDTAVIDAWLQYNKR